MAPDIDFYDLTFNTNTQHKVSLENLEKHHKPISQFDRKSSVQEKTSANFAILQGHHIAECSDSFGTFSSALKRNTQADKSENAEIRSENQRYHEAYNGQSNVQIKSGYVIFFLFVLTRFKQM